MTINLADNDPRISYTVASGTTQSTFTVPFEFFADADLNVYVDGTLKTLTSDYTVTGGDGATGSVSISVTGAAGGSTVVITRSISIERTTDFPTSGPFDIASLNTGLDKVIAIQADLKDDIDRSLRLTDFDSDVALTLPDVDTRKGKLLAFNETTGAVEAGATVSGTTTVAGIAADIETLADIEDGTDATDAIQTVAGISSNVTTVAGISSNVTTVAGISSDVSAVAADATDIGAVAAKATEIGRLGTADAVADMAILGTADVVADMNTLATSAIVTDMDALANLTSELDALADITSNITTVAGISANVTTVAGVTSNVTTVAGISSDVTTVAGISTDVAAVENISGNVTTVAGVASNVTTVAGIASDVSTVAADGTDIGTVAGISSNITTVAGNNSNITTVAGISGNVTTVAGISSDVTTVAGDSADIQTIATNINAGTFATKASSGANSDITSLTGITGGIDLNGSELILDSDADTSIHSSTDDQIDFKVGGGDRLVVDASGLKVTASSSYPRISITSGPSSASTLNFGDTDDEDSGEIQYSNSNNEMTFNTNNSTRMIIKSDGDVGIGTTSPDSGNRLHVSGGDIKVTEQYPALTLSTTGSSNTCTINFGDPQDDDAGEIQYNHSSNNMTFNANAATRMGLNANGLALGVSAPTLNGFEVYTTGSGRTVQTRNTTSSTLRMSLYYGNSSIRDISKTNQPGFNFTASAVIPAGGSMFNTSSDNVLDIGSSSNRWDDIYATNGTIQTSDANLKQQIAPLTDAEITAAKAISALFKTYKWNDSVAAKGDAARTHAGVVAQEVEAAMTAAGLNASDYAFFISTTWWEADVNYPAIEAADAIYDDDGNMVSPPVEAEDAVTIPEIFTSADDAPEGATECNRKGIRYPELLAFIGAATEQRLASIEARLTALEDA